MKSVNRVRATFKQLIRYFNQLSVRNRKRPLDNPEFVANLSLLSETIDYQLTFLYTFGRDLLTNLIEYCKILNRIGKVAKACFYGRYLLKKALFEIRSKRSSDDCDELSSKKVFQDVQISAFYLRQYQLYVEKFSLPKVNKDSNLHLTINSVKQLLKLDLEKLETVIIDGGYWRNGQVVITVDKFNSQIHSTYKSLLENIRNESVPLKVES